MTTLTITPDIAKKRLKLAGVVASGEKVAVTIDGFGTVDTSHLRLRVMAGNRAVGVFPLEDEDEWTISGSVLSCTLNLATEQAERFCRFGANVCVILEDMGTPQLYGVSELALRPWIKLVGVDVPVNLENYKIRLSGLEKTLLEHIECTNNPHKVTAKQVIGTDVSAEGGLLNIDATGIRCTGGGTDLRLYRDDDGSAHLHFEGRDLKFPKASATIATTDDTDDTDKKIAAHASRTDNPHAVTKDQVGLGSVDNTADKDKPVSDAQAAAIKAVSDAVDAEAARAKAAEAGKADASTVADLTSRVTAVESKKADKTAVTTLSTAVDGLKSSKRGTYDLAVYRRALYANLSVTLHDGSTGDVIGSNGFSTMCYLDSFSHGSESYRGQLGADLFLTVVLVTSGGEVTAPGYAVIEIDGESVTIGNLTLGNGNRNFSGSGFRIASEGDYEYVLDGQILSQEEVGTMSDETLLTSSDGTALKADAVSTAVVSAREKAKADRPFDVADVAAGATLAHSTVSRFSPADASEVAFTLADPPSGKMAEYELWVDCTAAAPASLTFRLANAQIDPRVEGGVEAMQAGRAYAYRVRAFGNPDAAHVTVLISQSEAAPAGYTPDQLYAPDSAFEIDTTKGDGLSFSVQVMATSATGDGGYATVHWGDGTKTRQYVTSLTAFTHTYARAGNYVVRISNADRFYLAGSPMVVRALRWGDTVTTAPGTYSACPNLGGTVPPWGKNMKDAGGSATNHKPDAIAASASYGAFTHCSGLTGPIPEWPDSMLNTCMAFAGCTGLNGEIPPWPKNCYRFCLTYAGCTGLTGGVPAWPTGWKDGTTNPSYLFGAFWHCSGLTGEIPPWIDLTRVSSRVLMSHFGTAAYAKYDYFGMFAGCTGLTGKIPKWPTMASGGTIYTNGLFMGCTGLEGIWDEGAADAEVMPASVITQHTDCVKGASEAVRRHFTAAWGGTKDAPSA